MSYQAQEFVANLRGLSRGEKAISFVIAHHLDQRNGVARISQHKIALQAEMSVRHVRTLTQAMAGRGVLTIHRSRDGKGSIAEYRFARFNCARKEEVSSALLERERRKSVTSKAKIGTPKEEQLSAPNKEGEKKGSVEKESLPNPPFQGGNSYRLAKRDLRRLSLNWERERNRLSDGGRNLEWKDLVRTACADLAIGFEDAVHDLLLMDQELWAARLDLKKTARSVSA